METIDTILEFWFGPLDAHGLPLEDRQSLWFGHNPLTDERIRERFQAYVERAARGPWNSAEAPRGRLAFILLLDQFSRNIYRGAPQAFAYDPIALTLAREGLGLHHDAALAPIERAFFYLPLEHAEDLATQEQSVQCYQALLARVPASGAALLRVFRDYAVRHRDIIARFGRFPHRNAILGRESTPEETAFLATPGSGF